MARRDTLVADSHRAIGHFIAEFQRLDSTLITTIKFILFKEGLKNDRIADIMLADLTMYPLKSIFQAMVAERMPKDATDFEKKGVAEILRRVDAMIEVRNKVAHGDIHVGGAHFEDKGSLEHLLILKVSRGRQGAETKRMNLKPADIDTWAHECSRLSDFLGSLIPALTTSKQRISEVLIRDENGVLGLATDEARAKRTAAGASQ